jgi:hypothetical protein
MGTAAASSCSSHSRCAVVIIIVLVAIPYFFVFGAKLMLAGGRAASHCSLCPALQNLVNIRRNKAFFFSLIKMNNVSVRIGKESNLSGRFLALRGRRHRATFAAIFVTFTIYETVAGTNRCLK